MTATDRSTSSGADPEFEPFILWMIRASGLRCEPRAAGGYTIELPDESSRRRFGGHGALRVVFDSRQLESDSQAILVTDDSPVLEWLIERSSPVLHAAPAGDPSSVHELAQVLYRAYHVDDGCVRLAGCSLEEHPFLRTTFLARDESGVHAVVHRFTEVDGAPVAAELVASLGFDQIVIHSGRPQVSRHQRLDDWSSAVPAPGEGARRLAVTVVWTRFAHGKLEFSIGARSVELRFEGWARLLRDGVVQPPPFVCPATGRASYHLAATDDGRISAVESLATCSESGRRVLDVDLKVCPVTGQRALAEYFGTCSYGGSEILASALTPCAVCREAVSPQVLSASQCPACQKLRLVRKDDPRMARVLGEYPLLDRWRKWRMSESQSVYVLIASSLARRLLLVIDKQTLLVKHAATRGLLSGAWNAVGERERQEWVGQA